jgi:hypothetical protein
MTVTASNNTPAIHFVIRHSDLSTGNPGGAV